MTTQTPGVKSDHAVKVTHTVSICRPAEELYAFWQNPENLMRVIKHPVSISSTAPSVSHWAVTEPITGNIVQWDSHVINEEPGKLIAWESVAGGDIAQAGTVRFTPAPGAEGTEVCIKLEFDPPGGTVGALLAKLSRYNPAHEVAEALRRFKALSETGEIPTTEGQSVGEPQKSKKQP